MSPAETDAHRGQHLDGAHRGTAVLELQAVLSLRLPSFYRCALRLLGNAADAEDAVQEALLAAYKHIDQFRGQSQMSTGLTTIVRNRANHGSIRFSATRTWREPSMESDLKSRLADRGNGVRTDPINQTVGRK